MTQEEIKAVNDAISFVAMAVTEPLGALDYFDNNIADKLPELVANHVRQIVAKSCELRRQTMNAYKGADFDIDLKR